MRHVLRIVEDYATAAVIALSPPSVEFVSGFLGFLFVALVAIPTPAEMKILISFIGIKLKLPGY